MLKRILFLLSLVAVPLSALGQKPQITTIQAQNAGTTVFTQNGFVRMNWTGGGCTASNSAGVLTINCTGGSGSGTVNTCAAAGNSYYAASGTTVSCDTSIVDNGAGQFTLGAGLVFSGASGANTTISTTTANANVIVAPNGTGALVVPAGLLATPGFQFSGMGATTGLFGTANSITWDSGGAAVTSFVSTGEQLGSARGAGWSSTAASTGTVDTGFWRQGAGVVEVSAGATAAATGSLLAATITAGTSFSANGTPGVGAGPFTAITAITTVEGIVTSLTGSSDRRLKTNIRPYTRGLEAILNLHPATYSWNAKGQKITNFPAALRQSGFIAQDVQKTIPEAVGKEPHDGIDYLTFSDRPVTAALVNAVKEQQAEIEELKREIEALRRGK